MTSAHALAIPLADAVFETGAILIKNGTELPEPLVLESDRDGTGWASVANHLNGRQLEKALTNAGWTFFYMAASIRTTAFGFERRQMVNAAMKRVIGKVRLQRCNCLEVDDVSMHSFLGIPYVSISAHPRHIQQGMVFSGQD
jgi:hypothetical protein